jgi:hypothetical protein
MAPGNRQQARALLLRAMSGHLSVEDFAEGWPEPGDSLIDAIFEETEDTVEHVPGYWLKRGTNHELFRKSISYKILVVDAQLLLDEFADIPSERLVEIRERLLKEVDLRADDDALVASAREFVAREIKPAAQRPRRCSSATVRAAVGTTSSRSSGIGSPLSIDRP